MTGPQTRRVHMMHELPHETVDVELQRLRIQEEVLYRRSLVKAKMAPHPAAT
jgi:hypothetical protein